MINLLVGPLAEAKYVALRDNECFSNNLINVNALYNYGGTSDLVKVYDYPLRQNSCRLKFLEKIKIENSDEKIYKVF
jgi:hypothetical protein